MSISSIKKILLAGTALVAVSAFGTQAYATAPLETAGTSGALAALVSENASTVAGTAGATGADAVDLTAGSLSGTVSAITLVGQNGAPNSTISLAGGNGGVGVSFNTQTGNTITFNTTPITGGNGGLNTVAAGAATGGAGGNGGDAVLINGITNSFTTGTGSAVLGGNGAAGVGATGGANAAGAGGAAGAGIHVTSAGATLVIGSNVTGGNAGASGTGGNNAITGLTGGIGINEASTGGSITINSGATVTGGTGAAGETAGGAATTAGLTGVAVNLSGATTLLSNAGTIGSATTETANALVIGGAITTMHNTGTITNKSNDAATGNATVYLNADQGAGGLTINDAAGHITNAGTTAGSVAVDLHSVQAGTITNAGTIQANGSGSSSAPTGTAVEFDNASTQLFSNTGTIIGNIIDGGTNSIATFTNTGTVTGNVLFTGAAAETVTLTSGTFGGNITMGNSNNTLTHTAGALNGNITLGNGTNTFTQTAGAVSGTVTSASGTNTLALNGGSIGGAISLGAGANVINVGTTASSSALESFTTSAAVSGTISTTVDSYGTFGIANTYTAGAGTLTVQNHGALNVTGAGTVVGSTGAFSNSGTSTFGGTSVTTVGAITNASTGIINLNGGTLSAGAQTISNAGAINLNTSGLTTTNSFTQNSATAVTTIGTAQTLSVASVAAGISGNTLKFEVKTGSTTTNGTNGLLASTGAVNLAGTNLGVAIDPTGGALKNFSQFEVITGSAVSGAVNPAGVNIAVSGTPTLVSTVGLDKFYAVLGGSALGAGFGGGTALGGATDVDLVAVTQSVSSLGSVITGNDTSVYNALLTVGNTTGFTTLQSNLNTAAASGGAAVHSLLQSLTPTVDGGAQQAALTVGGETQAIANTRMAALRDGDTSSGVAAGATANGVSMWIEGYGQHANQKVDDGIDGFSANTWGGAVGVDTSTLLDRAIVGVALNYGHSKIDSKNVNATSTDLGNYGVNLYGTYDLGDKMFVNGQLGYAYNTVDADRHNVGGAGGPTATSSTNSDQYSARVDAGRDYPVDGGLVLTPDVSANYTYLNTAGYTESGAGALDNTVGSNDQNVLGLGIGGTASWKLDAGNEDVVKPALHAGYTYEAIDDKVQTTSSFVGDPAVNFTTEGASPGRSVFDVGAKVVYSTKANWDVSATYDFQIKQDYTSNTGEVRATAHF